MQSEREPVKYAPCIIIYVFYVHTFAKSTVLLDAVFCLCRASEACA
jgi:hypothetical protein